MSMPQVLITGLGSTGIAIAFGLGATVAAAAGSSYVDIDSQSREISISPTTGEIVVGDRGLPATFCESKAKFMCFEAAGIAFAVPKDFDGRHPNGKWTYGGHDYVASRGKDDVTILGRRLRIYFIDASSMSPPLRYWYDPDRGVVAIQDLSSKSNVLLLRQACGFAAKPGCSN